MLIFFSKSKGSHSANNQFFSLQGQRFASASTRKIDKILIANRGEIACRVIRTAKKLGVKTVAVYSDADRNALYTKLADEAFHIGPSDSSESYLKGDKILSVALQSGAQAIHPGYGFLSENAGFSELLDKNGLIFIGPPPFAIQAMGSKKVSKEMMIKAKVPVVPGYHGPDQSAANFLKEAEKIGYPVLLKAEHGGGGKGMRIVQSPQEMDEAIESCKRESMKSFGNDSLLMEKYLQRPRHVEVQIFADKLGNCVYLFERDCSVQRRHQKIIEEAPAPHLTPELRKRLGESACDAAKAVGYVGAGTVEFIVENEQYYFMEMNTRLQVEHPITEMITRQDLVSWQIRVAEGQPLPLKQEDLKIHGHAFEARIYAENPRNNFLPGSGHIDLLMTPTTNENVRIDTGVVQGDEISTFYDPMISKLVVWDPENRYNALRRLTVALSEYHVAPINTNIQFLMSLARHAEFAAGNVHTGFIQEHHDSLFPEVTSSAQAIAFSAVAKYFREQQRALAARGNNLDRVSPWDVLDGFRVTHSLVGSEKNAVIVGNSKYQTSIRREGNNNFTVTISAPQPVQAEKGHKEHSAVAKDTVITLKNASFEANTVQANVDGSRATAVISFSKCGCHVLTGDEHFQVQEEERNYRHVPVNTGSLKAPMPGKVIRIMVKEGDSVKQGQPLVIMEAMKMEHRLNSPRDGVIKSIPQLVNSQVEQGASVIILEDI